MSDTFQFPEKLKPSWLVQRLNPPFEKESPLVDLCHVFSFGGGFKNGGLSKEGFKLLTKIFDFDYMGSAEFEFGILPSCLSFIASNQKDYVSGQVGLPSENPEVRHPRIYYICHEKHQDEIMERLVTLAIDPPQAKESIRLHDYFQDPPPIFCTRAVGWLDLNNGFMFFIDKAMWKKVCTLFGVAM